MNKLTQGIYALSFIGFFFLNWPILAPAAPLVEKDSVPMMLIPEGSFLRGSTENEGRADERPSREIQLDAFRIDQYEVTNARYREFLKETLHKPPMNVYGEQPLLEEEGIAQLPVVQVTWHDAVDYCFWAGKRLPTEAEWEKAARGTDTRSFPWGDSPPDATTTNFDKDWKNKETLYPVTSLPKGQSPYGLHHMSGNVREWVEDWYAPGYYATAPQHNPPGPETGILKVVRGGSWRSFEADLRVASRGKGGFALKTHGIGFRCARDIQEKTEESVESSTDISTGPTRENGQRGHGLSYHVVADYIHAIIEADRTLYTTHVVDRMQETGAVLASESWEERKALPLPAQMLQLSGERVAQKKAGLYYRLASLWPIYEKNGPANDFEQRGLEAIQQHPQKPYTGFTTRGKDTFFSAIYADRAISEACVNCHNRHVLSPKRNLQYGDVMGGIIISFPVIKP